MDPSHISAPATYQPTWWDLLLTCGTAFVLYAFNYFVIRVFCKRLDKAMHWREEMEREHAQAAQDRKSVV